MTGNLPERGYARSKRVCNDGFQDVARTNGALNDGCSTQYGLSSVLYGQNWRPPPDSNNDRYRGDAPIAPTAVLKWHGNMLCFNQTRPKQRTYVLTYTVVFRVIAVFRCERSCCRVE